MILYIPRGVVSNGFELDVDDGSVERFSAARTSSAVIG
jgi:hypothetical protein